MNKDAQKRTWRLTKSGVVKYRLPRQEVSLDGLNSLSKDVRNGIRATLPVLRSEKGNSKENRTLWYDFRTAVWRSSSGLVSEADLSNSTSLLEKRLDEAATDLNRIQLLPQLVHQRVVDLTPVYDSGFTFDRPHRTPKAPKRTWRRVDAEWIRGTLEASAIQPKAKDMFDMACDLLAGMDRPRELLWELDGPSGGKTHVSLYSTNHLLHAVPYVVRTKLTLGVDQSRSVDAPTNQRLILLSELLAFTQAVRLFAAGIAGDMVLTAYEVDKLDQRSAPTSIVQFQINSGGWLSELGKLTTIPVESVLGLSNHCVSVALPGDENWINGQAPTRALS
ncbi:hypothetical protein [Roseovarius pelagicus]|uniref:Uncharacterized protein n=1 Tax=Roseovarius pelagicus TaxID=2980108 RepID=A0ABY6DCN4_9RHOB|nr:hypothetical protein [Roseovarius pelagicus]UXX83794.1 hypothetical protein N7U68_03800 [Roseovarius pelagicus]